MIQTSQRDVESGARESRAVARPVWFIRHGESAANAGAATDDPATIPLTERGVRQAERASLEFAAAPGLIVTSPFLRARQTAQATADCFPETPVAVWPIQEFTYLSPAANRGSTAAERRPRVENYWERCDPGSVDGPGAESFAEMLERVRDMVRRLCGSEAGSVAVFAHQQVIQAARLLTLMNEADDRELMQAFRQFDRLCPIPNCAIVRAAVFDDVLLFGGTKVVDV